MSAVVASAAQIMEPQFLQADDHLVRAATINDACQFTYDFSWYSFIPTETLSTPAYYDSSTTTGLSATAYFTYCQDLQNTASPTSCSGTVWAAILDDTSNACLLNANSISMGIMSINETETVSLIYSNSDSTTNGGVSELTVGQVCDENASEVTTYTLTTSDGGLTYETYQESTIACPIFTYNALIQFVQDYNWCFGTGFIVIGLFLAFLGRKMFNVALFIVATIIVAGLILFIFYATFLSDNTEAWVSWLVVSLAVLVGLVGGFLAYKLEKIGACLLCGWGGFCLGVLLNETVLYLASSAVLFWCVNIGLAVIFGVLGFVLFNQAVMIATAFLGSYMTMRGIGLFAGGFPNEYALVNMIESGAISNIDPVFYAYLAGIFVMTILASIVQFKMFSKMEEAEKHPYNKLN